MPLSRLRSFVRRVLFWVWERSLGAALRQQQLGRIAKELAIIVPDLRDQYSDLLIEGSYLTAKVRAVHAFQIWLVQSALPEFMHPTIVDIGDSSGTHLRYLTGLASGPTAMRSLSVNMDAKAVERIRAKGLEAVHARAEELTQYNIAADIFLCFETLEHLPNPIAFLHDLATKTPAKYFIMTVPYVGNSRLGLHHIRNGRTAPVSAENTHLFELCPADWRLLVQHTGWRIVRERIYRQYPRWHPLWFTKFLWQRLDFEGFYGMVLAKDDIWANRYADW